MVLTKAPPKAGGHARLWTAALALLVVAVGIGAGLAIAPGSTPAPGRPVAAPTHRAPQPSAPAALGGAVAVPATGAYLGAYSSSATPGRSAISGFERLIAHHVTIDHQYYWWDQPFPTAVDRQALAAGHIPLWNWQSRLTDGKKLTWSSIADGSQDAVINARARAVAAFGHPVFLAFQHEPEALAGTGPGKEGTAAAYQAAWRHVVSRFRAEGVTNVSWVWILTARSFRQPAVADSYYPGDSYVSWVAADGYNFFGCKPRVGGNWRSAAQIFQAFYRWAAARPKPAMLAEWGSVEDPAVPGRKGAWIRQAQQTFQTWPRIKAYVYFNASPGCRNQVDTSPSSLAAFTQLAGSRYFQARPTNP